jgi:hypothetical protein
MGFDKILKKGWTPVSSDSKEDDGQAKESFLPSEEDFLPNHKPASRKHTILSHVATFIVAVLLSVALFTTYHGPLSKPASGPTKTTKRLECGNTTAEARANDCVYDFLSNMVNSPLRSF